MKKKHYQSRKQKYYSNLILNRYVIKNVVVNKFKDVFNLYFKAHSKQINFFTLCVYLRFDDDEDPCNRKITVSNNVTYNIQSEHYTTYATQQAPDFLHRDVVEFYLSHECSPELIPEIEIVFISHLRYITRHIISNNQNQLSVIN